MKREEFEGKVLRKLKKYAPKKTDKELRLALSEYSDLVEEGYNHYQGIEYGCDYAAWNISMCI